MIVQNNGDVYEGNYAYGGLSINQIIEAFPYIGSKKFDEIVGKGISKDGKVHYYYLECGNHLFVRDSVHRAFLEVVKKRKGSDTVDAFSWYEMACIVCPDKNRKEMLRMVRTYCNEIEINYPDGYPDTITDRELKEWTDSWDDFDPFPELK
jgi:hypothetical protein